MGRNKQDYLVALLWIFYILTVSLSCYGAITTWDLASDYAKNMNSNPNGQWQYVYEAQGQYKLLNVRTNRWQKPLLSFWGPIAGDYTDWTGLYYNPNAFPVSSTSAVGEADIHKSTPCDITPSWCMSPSSVAMHPNYVSGEGVGVRFTAPSNGVYSVTAVFKSIDNDLVRNIIVDIRSEKTKSIIASDILNVGHKTFTFSSDVPLCSNDSILFTLRMTTFGSAVDVFTGVSIQINEKPLSYCPCSSNNDCANPKPICDILGGTYQCVPCKSSAECDVNQSTLPVCIGGLCQKCTEDSQCLNNKSCASTGACGRCTVPGNLAVKNGLNRNSTDSVLCDAAKSYTSYILANPYIAVDPQIAAFIFEQGNPSAAKQYTTTFNCGDPALEGKLVSAYNILKQQPVLFQCSANANCNIALGKCEFCPANQIMGANKICQACPPGTASASGDTVCKILCGNSDIDPNEDCDLGSNNGKGKGCDSQCKVESNWKCMTSQADYNLYITSSDPGSLKSLFLQLMDTSSAASTPPTDNHISYNTAKDKCAKPDATWAMACSQYKKDVRRFQQLNDTNSIQTAFQASAPLEKDGNRPACPDNTSMSLLDLGGATIKINCVPIEGSIF